MVALSTDSYTRKGLGLAASTTQARRPLRAVLGVILVLVCSLGGALVVRGVDSRHAALIVAHNVAGGEAITAADLSVTEVAGHGLVTVAPSQEPSLLGRPAIGPLEAGTLVSASEFERAGDTSAGQVELPMTLKQGDAPPGLSAGDSVLIVSTPLPGSIGAGKVAPPVPGTVTRVEIPGGYSGSGSVVVSVLVPRQRLVSLADAAANGSVVLAKEPR